MLQALATQVVPAVIRGIFSNTHKHTSSAMCLGMYFFFKNQAKTLISKFLFMGEGREGRGKQTQMIHKIHQLVNTLRGNQCYIRKEDREVGPGGQGDEGEM